MACLGYDPSKTCLLYEETQTIDTSTSSGMFSVQVGQIATTAGDPRVMQVKITPSTTGIQVTLSPDETIDSVPQAWSAETFQGITLGNFIQLSGTDAVIPTGDGLKINGSEVIDSTGHWIGSSTGLVGATGATGTSGATGATGSTGGLVSKNSRKR